MSNTENTVALITGSNRGIGFETAKELGEKGIQVILAVRDHVDGEAAAEKLQALGIKAAVVPYEAGKLGQPPRWLRLSSSISASWIFW